MQHQGQKQANIMTSLDLEQSGNAESKFGRKIQIWTHLSIVVIKLGG